MASKHNRTISRRGRTVHSPNPQRAAFVPPQPVEVPAIPVSIKEAKRLANGTALPTMPGVFIQTLGGKRLVARKIKKGAVTYKFALV